MSTRAPTDNPKPPYGGRTVLGWQQPADPNTSYDDDHGDTVVSAPTFRAGEDQVPSHPGQQNALPFAHTQPNPHVQPQQQQPHQAYQQPHYQHQQQPHYQQPQQQQPHYQQQQQPHYQQQQQPHYQQPQQPHFAPGQPPGQVVAQPGAFAQPHAAQQPHAPPAPPAGGFAPQDQFAAHQPHGQPVQQHAHQFAGAPGCPQMHQQHASPAPQATAGYAPAAAAAMSAPPAAQGRSIANADATVGVRQRVRFLRLTYLHLLIAILAFVGIEWMLFRFAYDSVVWPMTEFSLGGRFNWLAVLAAFMAVSYIADRWAESNTSRGVQYLGLGLYVIAEAIIFIPLLVIAQHHSAEFLAKHGQEAHIIRDAALLTIALFSGLTLSVFISKKDFSFLRSGLMLASSLALGLIIMSIAFGFGLGMLFSVAMIVLAAGYVLYYTSRILAHYNPSQYVAASLALFSCIALMFWYMIRLLMKLRQ